MGKIINPTVNRATVALTARRLIIRLLTLVLVVSTLSAISVFAPLQTSFASQVTQSSFDFNTGTASQVMKTASNAGPIPASSNFSVESWVYIDSDTGSWQTIMSQNQPSTSCCTGRFYMGFPSGRNLHIGFETNYTDVAVIPTTTWTHIALTLQRNTPSAGLTTTKTYINGLLVQNKTDWPNNTFSSANGFSVGSATDGGYKLNGKIDQVKIWDGVLSQSDVERSMSAYAAGGISTGTLRAHYDFNEGTGTTIADRSGISANLTVNSGDSVFSQSPTPPVTTSATPTNVTGTAGYKQANVSWTAPTFNGGSIVTGYTVTSSPLVTAPAACVNTSNTSCTFTGLTEGTSYTFTVVATNVKGNSSSSAASSSLAPFGDCSNEPTISGGFAVVTFTSVSTCNWSVPAGVTSADVLVVGGGGGGGDSTTSATGGGGGAGGYFYSSSVAISGNIIVTVGAGGTGGASSTTNGTSGGDSAFGTLKVGGGGYGNSVSFAASQRAGSGIGGSGYVSGGSGGGGRSRGAGINDAKLGGIAGARDASGVAFLGTTYTGLSGADGGNAYEGDLGSGSFGGAISSSSRTSSISGSSTVYSKGGTFRPWDSNLNTERPQTYGSGGAANYNYGSAETAGNTLGGNGAQGVVIVKYAMPAVAITTPSAGLTGSLGSAYSLTLSTSGGSGSGTFSIASGSLPAGVTLNTSSGVISGTPTATGTYAIAVTITDTNTTTATTSSFSIVVNSNVATLSNLVLSSGTLSPSFASNVTSYTASVANAVSSGYTITATKTDSNATTVQYIGADGTTAFTGALSVGENIIRTIVTAQNGSTSTTYTVTVTRAAASRTITIDASSFTSTYAMTATAPTLTSTASAGSGTKSYTSSTLGVCTVNSSSGVVVFVSAGTCTITASITADATYASATSASISFTTTLVTQTVTWAPTTALLTTASPATPSVLATALDSATISYAVTSAGTTGCTVNSSTAVLTFTAAGSCTVRASSVATANYAAATKDVTFVITEPTYTITYAYNNATGGNSNATSVFTVGGDAITLPIPTRTNFTFEGWYTESAFTNLLGATLTPTASGTIYARWTQNSLYGLTNLVLLETSLASDEINKTFTFSVPGSTASVSGTIPAGALEAGTEVSFWRVPDFTRAEGVLGAGKEVIISLVVSWLATDGTVQDTAAGKPISILIQNTTITKGMRAYAIVNGVATPVGTATEPGKITVELTQDPEVVVVTTKPDAPTGVTATSNGNTQSVISWSAPASDGGSAITGYTVTSSPSVTAPDGCTNTANLSCTFTGLTNGTVYSFTVTATNEIGTSDASTAAYGAPGSVSTTFTRSDTAITTSAFEGFVVTAVTTNLPTGSYTYQWFGGSDANSLTAISGATFSTYTPKATDRSLSTQKYLSVRVVATISTRTYTFNSPAIPVYTYPNATGGSVTAPSPAARGTFTPGKYRVGQTVIGHPWQVMGTPWPTLNYQWWICNTVAATASPAASGCTMAPGEKLNDIAAGFQLTPLNCEGRLTASVAFNTSGSYSECSLVTYEGATYIAHRPSYAAVNASGPDGYYWTVFSNLSRGIATRIGGSSGTNIGNPFALDGHGFTYVVPSEAAGKFLTFTATLSNEATTAQGTVFTFTQSRIQHSGMINSAPNFSGTLAITGTPKVGTRVSATGVTYSGTPAGRITYQWMRSDTAGGTYSSISGATSSSYVPVSGDQGKYLQVVATATNNAGATATRTSAASAQITAVPSGILVSLGSPPTLTRGTTLTAALTPATSGFPTLVTYEYQWQRCATPTSGCSNIGSVTPSTTYTTVATNNSRTDVGKHIRVGVRASNTAGTSAWVYSIGVGPII